MYEQPLYPAFEEARTLLGVFYDILTGVDPYTGTSQPAYGTPGTLQENFFGPNPFTHAYSFYKGEYRIPGRPAVRERPWWAK